jgi:prepilin peptidase CpaA
MSTPLIGLTLLVLSAAVYTDLRSRRIPNAFTLPAAAAGLGLNLLWHGMEGLGYAALGWIVGVGLLLVPFMLRGIGAGDVKLLAAVGALQGPVFVFFTALYGALIGGVLATVMLQRSGSLGAAVQSLVLLRFLPRPVGQVITTGRMPYAPAIALGACAALLTGVGP